jgi:hypothetical protein
MRCSPFASAHGSVEFPTVDAVAVGAGGADRDFADRGAATGRGLRLPRASMVGRVGHAVWE